MGCALTPRPQHSEWEQHWTIPIPHHCIPPLPFPASYTQQGYDTGEKSLILFSFSMPAYTSPHRRAAQLTELQWHSQPMVWGHMAMREKDVPDEGTAGDKGRTAHTFETTTIPWYFGNTGSFRCALLSCLSHGPTEHRELKACVLPTGISVADLLI